MGRIVLLTSQYLGKSSANGICARNLADALSESGHEMQIICYADGQLAEKRTYTVSKPSGTSENRLLRFFHRMKTVAKLVTGIGAPVSDKKLIRDYYAKLEQLHAEKPIDLVLAMYFPTESVQAAYRFKYTNPQVKFAIYELDSVGDGVAAASSVKKLVDKQYEKWLNHIYAIADCIFVMQSHEAYWKDAFGKKFADKLCLTDLPVLRKIELPRCAEPQGGPTVFLYGGLIEKAYRDPTYMLSVFKALSKKADFKFYFYSKGDCENDIVAAAEEYSGFILKGYVPPEELDKGIANADFLVSIGNAVSNSVPSKLINYMSCGKPVIHFSAKDDDICDGYLKKYPLSLVVKQSQNIEESVMRLMDFIIKARGKTTDFGTVRDLFCMNDPSYSARLISDGLAEERKLSN